MIRYLLIFFISFSSFGFSMEKLKKVTKKDISKSTTQLGFSILNILNNENNNLIFSPFSIASSLYVLLYGSNGITHTQMLDTLNVRSSQKSLLNSYNSLYNDLFNQKDKCTFLLSNMLFVDVFSQIYESYENILKTYFHTKIEKGNFAKNKQLQVEQINRYFALRSEFTIPNIISTSDIFNDTKFLALNTLFMKSIWSSPFNLSESEPGAFYLKNNTEITVYKMRQINKFLSYEDNQFQIAALPLKCKTAISDIQFLIFLPKEDHSIHLKYFNKVISKLSHKELNIRLPRFSLGKKFLLKEPLEKLGIRQAFTRIADFSNINGRLDLYLNNVIHESTLKVDENGLNVKDEDIQVSKYKIKQNANATIFDINRPFYFIIYDFKSKTVLLIGKVQRPDINV